MALKNGNNGRKGLFMTILVLILFFLILGELFSFALLTMSYNNVDQSSALGASSLNYGKSLSASASLFANASLSRAIYTLANYELNATMRQDNFITNTSQYLTYLIVNGTLPGVSANSIPANYLLKNMGNLTLAKYNSSLALLLGSSAVSIKVNQTKPLIFQASPYSLSVSYLEYVALNSTGGRFVYPIGVNATISLNGTPDLLYYQQGVARNIRFASLSNLTSVFPANVAATQNLPLNATAGNYLASIYGPIYNVPSGVTCANLESSLPASFTFSPNNQMLIIATPNAIGITNGGSGPNCAQKYGGLITYAINSVANPPAMPWISYPTTSNYLSNLRNGQQVLLLGNTLSVYNIQNLIKAASSGYYFASPFTPSYLDRAQGSLTRQNPSGIFSFANYNLQAATFNGPNAYSYVSTASNALLMPNSITISLWVYSPNVMNTKDIIEKGIGAGGYQYFIRTKGTGTPSLNNLELAFANTARNYDLLPASSSLTLNSLGWHHILLSVNDISQIGYAYMDGALKATNTPSSVAFAQNSNALMIGGSPWDVGFNGSIANVQIYNVSINSQQAAQLYQEGISGAPLNNNALVGWWPLNGNPGDYSGYNYNSVPSNTIFQVPKNYTRDSIFGYAVPTATSAIPGLLGCKTPSQCSSSSAALVYAGYLPLELQQNSQQVLGLNGVVGYLNIGSTLSNTVAGGYNTATFWMLWKGMNAQGEMPIEFSGTGLDLYFQTASCFGFNTHSSDIWGINPTNTLNKWVFVAATFYNGYTSNGLLYINGANQILSQCAGTQHSILASSNVRIGGGYSFNGSIANFQLYNQSLSANQIGQLYREGIAGTPILSANLVGWWPLNGNSNDYSGFSNNAVPAGNVIYTSFASTSYNTYNAVTGSFTLGSYNAPGVSTIVSTGNEWQSIGLPRAG